MATCSDCGGSGINQIEPYKAMRRPCLTCNGSGEAANLISTSSSSSSYGNYNEDYEDDDDYEDEFDEYEDEDDY